MSEPSFDRNQENGEIVLDLEGRIEFGFDIVTAQVHRMNAAKKCC